jgi:hypothetical protein
MSRSRFERHSYLESDSQLKKEEAEEDNCWFQECQNQRRREQQIRRKGLRHIPYRLKSELLTFPEGEKH